MNPVIRLVTKYQSLGGGHESEHEHGHELKGHVSRLTWTTSPVLQVRKPVLPTDTPWWTVLQGDSLRHGVVPGHMTKPDLH